MNDIIEVKKFFSNLRKLGVKKIVFKTTEFNNYFGIIVRSADFLGNSTPEIDSMNTDSYTIFGVKVEKE